MHSNFGKRFKINELFSDTRIPFLSDNIVLSALWILIPYCIIVFILIILVVRMYYSNKQTNKLNKNLTEYIKTVHDLQKSLELLYEPLNEVSVNTKMDDAQRDKIRLAIWRIHTMQTTLKNLMSLEKEDYWINNQIQIDTPEYIHIKTHSDDSTALEEEPEIPIIGTPNNNDQYFLEKVFAIIREHYVDANFNVDNLSQKMGMSRSSFYNKIKAISGQAPADFIRQYRMERAKELLKTRQYTITEVALKSGFTDVKYFRDVFRKKYNRSPSQYAKSNQP